MSLGERPAQALLEPLALPGLARRRWDGLDTAEKARWHGVVLCGALFLVHFTLLSSWYIEDAAITFSFARNAAMGEGFVAWPGGERVEGFSNPTWTLLLAVTHLVGINPFIAAKLYGGLFGLLTLPLAYLWARRLVAAGRSGDPGLVPVLAPLLLAVSPQHVIWAASGLENGLLGLCLAGACVLLLREARTGGRPWSGLALGLLALTRPDAPLYAAIAGGLGVALAARERGPAALPWILRTTAVALIPFAAWHLWSWWYFAWPLPNTYYAKLAEADRFQPFKWQAFPWRYLRGWALQSTWGFYLPLAGVIAAGLTGWRGRLGASCGGALAILLLPGLAWPQVVVAWEEPDVLVSLRVWALLGFGLLLPLLGLGRRGHAERALAWYLAVAAVFFALYAGGDWMKGHRWLATAQVPLAVLAVDLVATTLRTTPTRAQWWVLGLLAGPLVAGSVAYSARFLGGVETSPYDVYQRVHYMHGVQRRLHLDHVTQMEVDFGAQMWWTGHELIDMVGLNDVPMAHHAWEGPFVDEYVFEERLPDFAHVHGGWKNKTKMGHRAAFNRDYLEIPGYPANRRFLHVGNHVRRDLFIRPHQPDTDVRTARFGPALELVGLEVPAPTVAAGQTLYVELGWRALGRKTPAFRALAFLVGQGREVVWELPPGYDWLPTHLWRRSDVITGRHSLPLPDDLPAGSYDLGLVVMKSRGEVVPADEAHAEPAVAVGELRWADAVEVAPLQVAEARLAGRIDDALTLTAAGQCAEAEQALEIGRRHLAPDHPAQPRERADVRRALADCWAALARTTGDHDVAEHAIRSARRWDHRAPDVIAVGRALADAWQARGDDLLADERLDEAYDLWRRALLADPTRSWLRRRAEALRDRRLGLREEDE